jgi:hypothetical protein
MLISDLFGGAMTMINKISRGSVGALFILSLIGRWLSSWTLHLYNWKKSHAGQWQLNIWPKQHGKRKGHSRRQVYYKAQTSDAG